jgi:hypothetical protein
MANETTPMQELSNCGDGRIEMTTEIVLGIARVYIGRPLHDGTVPVGHYNVTFYYIHRILLNFGASNGKTAEQISVTARTNFTCGSCYGFLSALF